MPSPQVTTVKEVESPVLFFLSVPPRLPEGERTLNLVTLDGSVVVTTLKLPVPGLVVIVPSTLTSVVLTSLPEVKALGFSTGVSACLLGLIGEVCSPGSSELHFIWQNDRLTAVSSFIFVEFRWVYIPGEQRPLFGLRV